MAGTAVHGPGRTGGEAVFAPRPGGKAEDDGWLLTFVYDAGKDASELVVYDAQRMGGPIARLAVPQRVPNGFHGLWVPLAELDKQRSD